MRHGEAAFKSEDPKQGLTPEGKRAIEKLARQLVDKFADQTKERNIGIKQIFHSEKTRAQETAEIMANIIAPEVTPLCHENLKPNDNPSNLLTDINTWTQDTLITSHLPLIPGLLNLLTTDQGTVSFEPGTIACLDKSGSSWQLEWVARSE